MSPSYLKEQFYELVQRLPEDAGWDEVFYAICVRIAAEHVLGSPVALPAFAQLALRARTSQCAEEA